jgi:hypothetical protein
VMGRQWRPARRLGVKRRFRRDKAWLFSMAREVEEIWWAAVVNSVVFGSFRYIFL